MFLLKNSLFLFIKKKLNHKSEIFYDEHEFYSSSLTENFCFSFQMRGGGNICGIIFTNTVRENIFIFQYNIILPTIKICLILM